MATTQPTPDLLLARRAAAGQAQAWEELIDGLGRRIYNMALQFTGRQEEAEDLTQEVFLRLYRNLKKYRGDVPLSAWALRLSRKGDSKGLPGQGQAVYKKRPTAPRRYRLGRKRRRDRGRRPHSRVLAESAAVAA